MGRFLREEDEKERGFNALRTSEHHWFYNAPRLHVGLLYPRCHDTISHLSVRGPHERERSGYPPVWGWRLALARPDLFRVSRIDFSIRPALDPPRNRVGCLSTSPDLFHMLRSCLNTVPVLRQRMSGMNQLSHLHFIFSPSSLYMHPSTRPFYQWPSRTLYCCIIVNSGCSFSRIRFHPSGR